MADGNLGLGSVLTGVLLRPRRFFEAVKTGQVTTAPFHVYLLTSALGGVGTGGALTLIIGGPAALCIGLAVVAGLLFAPLWWFVDVRLTLGLVRLVGGKGTSAETRQVIGFSSMPNALAAVPFAGLPAAIWALFARISALRVLHLLSPGRAAFVALGLQGVAFLGSVGLATSLRAVVLEAFKVPSGSMFPSVELGDHLFVSKSAYGAFHKSPPARGDVVVFEYPEPNPSAERVDYVKRVIALPGDELAFESGAPIINGWQVPRCRLGSAKVNVDPSLPDETDEYEIFLEFLSGQAYLVAFQNGRDDGHQGPYRIAADEFWVVGDNRNNSSDSRSWSGGRGAGVPFDHLKGRARWLWFPTERLGIDLAAAPVLPQKLSQLAPELARCLAAAPDLEHTRPPPPPPPPPH